MSKLPRQIVSSLVVVFALTFGSLSLDAPPARAAGTLFVKPHGNGNCSSWAKACRLQTALTNAVSGDQIWVASGTYKPTGDGNRTVSFELKSGVALYGGFKGTESSLSQRNPAANVTTLSGDLNGNDSSSTNNGENSYHVVVGSNTDNTAVLDGFTVRGGNADGVDYPDYLGGGIYNDNGSPVLTGVTFSNNSAYRGGGMYNDNGSNPALTNVTFSSNSAQNGGGMLNEDSNPALTNVTFSGNSAQYDGGGMYNRGSSPTLTNVTFSGNSSEQGGGMSNWNSSSPTLTNVTFSGNSAQYGGGMQNDNSNPVLTNVTFSGNSAQIRGGGMYNGSSSPTLTNVTFSGNSAQYGGGMANWYGNPSLTNVAFSGNSAQYDGGGMYNWYHSSPTLTNVTFSDNFADHGGGGMYNDLSSPALTNVTFSNNSAQYGGGMYNYNVSNPALIDVTFSGNSAQYGGGMLSSNGNSPTLTNVTFSNNSAQNGGGMYNDNGSSPALTNVILANSSGGNCAGDTLGGSSAYNLIDDTSCGGVSDGSNGNKIGATYDAKLAPLANNGGFTQTLALLPGSDAIDAGANSACPATDQRGVTRPQITHCDIGAYEAYLSIAFNAVPNQDGWVLESSETSNKGGSINKGATFLRIGDDALNRQYRAILSFDTSALPDNATIYLVTLKIKRKGVAGGGNPINIFKGFKVDFATSGVFGNPDLEQKDFQAPGVTLAPVFKPALTGGWYSLDLSAGSAQVNPTGTTQIRLRFKLDDNNNNIANFLKIYSGNAELANRPQLIIEYATP